MFFPPITLLYIKKQFALFAAVNLAFQNFPFSIIDNVERNRALDHALSVSLVSSK